jgi:predicted nuclease with TOPRIM domain
MDKTREELQKELDEANAQLEQYQHRCQRLENRLRYYTEGERKKRNHRLITRGADVESVAPEVRGMSQTAFRLLVEEVFSLPEVTALVSRATDQQEGG